MSLLSRKKKFTVAEFCSEFYEKNILNPVIEGVDFGSAFFDTIRKNLIEVDNKFTEISSEKLASAMIPLRFEIFALAWMHRFGGKFTLYQSVFTKFYLDQKGRDDIWKDMAHYNNFIDSAVLHWLTSLGRMNLGFWYGVREDLTKQNVEGANKMEIDDEDVVTRVNHRLCSETAWKQKSILEALLLALYERLGINVENTSKEANFRLAATIKGLYDGAKQALDDIEIEGLH